MSSTAKEQLIGPIEDQAWADKLRSRVVEPGPEPRIHGYDVEGDLAHHYDFLDTMLLCVLGEIPNETQRRAMGLAMQFAAPMSVAHAPTHAAMLVRLCGATSSASFAAGAFGLAEDARATVESHAAWLAFLENPGRNAPELALAKDDDERRSVSKLRALIAKTGARVPGLAFDASRTAAVLAILFACGARASAQLELLLILARLATVGAESIATTPTQFREYPLTLPPFRFEASHDAH